MDKDSCLSEDIFALLKKLQEAVSRAELHGLDIAFSSVLTPKLPTKVIVSRRYDSQSHDTGKESKT